MQTAGMAPHFSGEFWLAPLAVVAQPAVRNMLIVGYGGGVIVEAVPPSVRSIDVIELEPQVIEANNASRSLRKRDPLLDSRLTLISNDARGALALTTKRYDAIVSQPSHPWTAGASHLYTREFMAEAREHLNADGIFVQWMNVAFVDEPLLRSLTATLLDVFSSVRLYRPDPSTLVFVAGSAASQIERRVACSGAPLRLSAQHYSRYGIETLEDLIGALAVDEDGMRLLAASAPLISDDNNRMANSSVFEWGRGLSPDAMGRVLAAYDPLQRERSWVYRDYRSTLDFAYMARRMGYFRGLDASVLDRMARMQHLLGDTAQSAAIAVMLLEIHGEHDAARDLLRSATLRFPDNAALRYARLHEALEFDRPPAAEQAAMVQSLPPAAQATLRGLTLLSAGQFGELAHLDAALAQARYSDPWFLESNQLRAEWRARIANPELRRRLGTEAIELLDRAALQLPSLQLYATRVRAGLTAEQPAVLLESLASFVKYVGDDAVRASAERRAAARVSTGEMLQLLESQAALPGMDPGRVVEVRAQLRDLAQQLH